MPTLKRSVLEGVDCITLWTDLVKTTQSQIRMRKRAERTKRDFWCLICPSAIGRAGFWINIAMLSFPKLRAKHLIQNLTNRQQFFMVCTLMDHRNDVKMFKTQGEWFHCKVFDPYGRQEYRPWKLFSISFSTIILGVFDIHFRWTFAENREQEKRKWNCATITSFPWSVLLSTIQWETTQLL